MMEFTYDVTFLKCQSCDAKIHCDRCSEEAAEKLLRHAGVSAVRLDLKKKTVTIAGDDEDVLLDALDNEGIFAD